MFLRRTLPWRPLEQLRDELDRQVSGLFDELPGMTTRLAGSRVFPAVNVWEEGEGLVLTAELPGVKSEELHISVVGNDLTLQGERKFDANEEQTFHRRERGYGSFTRVLRLPYAVDAERVTAALKDGVLTLTLPKHESAKPRKIDVNVGG